MTGKPCYHQLHFSTHSRPLPSSQQALASIEELLLKGKETINDVKTAITVDSIDNYSDDQFAEEEKIYN